MLNATFDFSPSIYSRSSGIAHDWDLLHKRLKSWRSKLEYLKDDAADLVSQFSFLSEDLIIRTLRSGESSENIYWMLRYFYENNKQNPVIQTDKGKTLFIEYDYLDDSIVLYVGYSDECYLLSQNEQENLNVLVITEKYEFTRCAEFASIIKRQYDALALVEIENFGISYAQELLPVLYFRVSSDKSTEHSAVCVLRNEESNFIKENIRKSNETGLKSH